MSVTLDHSEKYYWSPLTSSVVPSFTEPSLLLAFVAMTFNYFWIWTLPADLFFSTRLCPRLQLCPCTPPCETVLQIGALNKGFAHWCKICDIQTDVSGFLKKKKIFDQTLWWLCWKYPSVIPCHRWWSLPHLEKEGEMNFHQQTIKWNVGFKEFYGRFEFLCRYRIKKKWKKFTHNCFCFTSNDQKKGKKIIVVELLPPHVTCQVCLLEITFVRN